MNETAEEGPGSEHHGGGFESQAQRGHGTPHPVAFDDQVVDSRLEQPQVRLGLETAPDGRAVEDPVRLGPRSANRGALARVQRTELDPRLIGGNRHGAAERIDLPYEVPLADAADRGVARHLAEGLQGVREQKRLRPGAGGGERGLGAGVAATHHDHVETVREIHRFRAGKEG